ncbi:MAG: DEAD/DEAH box helicase [Bacteroidetes bacterium]|nr:MAG: DEAD/DEAH box helicase [Bacteroidota bacterium]
MKFDSLHVGKAMVSLLERHGITTPTIIQKEIIPAIKEGRDVLAQSETGSGKTLSFAIPILEQTKRSDGLTTLVLVPTRELCAQVAGEFVKFSQGNHLGITSVYGGVSINNQARKMKTTNIIVATPGRLIDLLDRNVVRLDTIKNLVLDEADRMLDMGFIPDIERILKRMPQKKQTMLFSATVSKEIERLSMSYLDDPILVSLESKVKPEFLQQTYYQTTPDKRMSLLIHLLKNERDLALVFCNKKHVTAKLAKKLSSQGINARCLHGDMTQPQRERATAEFRNKKINVLIATDVAARGLHIEDITHVYNYEIPRDVESYTHRVGRTARAGKKGEAISLVATDDDKKFFKQILFTYRGSITLKFVDAAELPVIEQTPREKARKQREKEEPVVERQLKKQDKRRPREDKRHQESSVQHQKNRQGGDDERSLPPRNTMKKQEEEKQKQETSAQKRRDELYSHSARHKEREEYERLQRERRGKGEQREQNPGDKPKDERRRSQLPKDRPRRRKPFEKEFTDAHSRRGEIPDMRKETSSSQQEDKKKKRNWKEMWERLVGG